VTPFVSSFFLLISVRLRVVDSTYLASGYPSGFERTCAFISCALFDSQKFGGNENIDLRRDALHSARCLSVRVSVRPSHAGILSKRLNISCNFFSPLDSRTILVFLIPNSMAILRRDPPSDGVECMGCVKKLFFGYRFMSEITQGTDIVTMECE